MHIAVNATVTSQQEKTGIAMYATNLIRSMREQSAAHSYDVFTLQDPDLERTARTGFNVRTLPGIFRSMPIEFSWAAWYAWYYTGFKLQLGKINPDVYLSFDFSLPAYKRCPRVGMVYDLTPLQLPGAYPERFKARFRMQVAHAVRHADRIVTISWAVKQDIREYFDVDAGKIDVVYPGYDDGVFTAEKHVQSDRAVLARHGIDYPYILFLGALEQKKNLPRLIEAYGKIKRGSGIPQELVLGGKHAWSDRDVFEKIIRSPVSGDINYIGYVPYRDLPALMRNADLFVFPSLNEGFGIPPLEAMACGTPVITSNVSALPEVAGDAGVMVDPYNVDDIAEAMLKVLLDPDFRQTMVSRGLKQSELFSWRKAGADMLEILAKAAGR